MITSKLRSLRKSRFLRFCAAWGVLALLSAGVAAGQNFEAVQKRLKKAVKKGEISPEQARIMMAALQKSATAGKARKPAPGESKKEPKATKKKAPAITGKRPEVTKASGKTPGPDPGAAWAKLTALVDEGKISKEDAIAKMAALKKEAARKDSAGGGKEAPGKGGAKKEPGRDHEALARKLKAAVAAGKLTPEQAQAKWDALQKQGAGPKKAREKK